MEFCKEHKIGTAGCPEVQVNTKYKTVARKVKPVALPLPEDTEERIEGAALEPNLRDPRGIGHSVY